MNWSVCLLIMILGISLLLPRSTLSLGLHINMFVVDFNFFLCANILAELKRVHDPNA